MERVALLQRTVHRKNMQQVLGTVYQSVHIRWKAWYNKEKASCYIIHMQYSVLHFHGIAQLGTIVKGMPFFSDVPARPISAEKHDGLGQQKHLVRALSSVFVEILGDFIQRRIGYPKSDFRVPIISRKMGLSKVEHFFSSFIGMFDYFPNFCSAFGLWRTPR